MFLEMTVQECFGDIKLYVWLSSAVTRRGEHGANGRKLDDRGESLVEVHTNALCESANHQLGLVAFQCVSLFTCLASPRNDPYLFNFSLCWNAFPYFVYVGNK